jgi:dTDP-4-dehydrorhamnose reductase
MKVLVTGARGQLGRALERAAAREGRLFVGADLPELDITDRGAVLEWVASERPDALINGAAFTAVDAAETREEEALAVNGAAVGHLAEAADAAGAVLVQVSTDYVFDGEAERAYREDDPVNPLSAYGRTKLAGERAAELARNHLVARTAWLFGEGANFVESILAQIAAGRGELRVVDDQVGCPTYAEDLATGLLALLDRGARGTLHVTNAGATSWFGFAQEIVGLSGATMNVVPVATADVPRPARRPRRAVLDTSRLAATLGTVLPPWQDALSRYLLSPWRRPR